MATKPKQKRIQLSELQEGLQVVVNTLPDAQVYTVKSVNRLLANLVYFVRGHEVEGGIMDYSCMYHPTQEQLANEAAGALDMCTVHMRSNTTGGTDTQVITVHKGQNAREEGKRVAESYGATLLAIEPQPIAAPALDHDAHMLKRFNQKVIPRGRVERRVMANLLNYLAANGFSPVLLDDSDEDNKVSDIKSVMELAFNLDECRVYFDYNGSGKPQHWIFFVFGNDGPDIVNDYGCPVEDKDGWNAVMDLFNPEDYA